MSTTEKLNCDCPDNLFVLLFIVKISSKIVQIVKIQAFPSIRNFRQ